MNPVQSRPRKWHSPSGLSLWKRNYRKRPRFPSSHTNAQTKVLKKSVAHSPIEPCKCFYRNRLEIVERRQYQIFRWFPILGVVSHWSRTDDRAVQVTGCQGIGASEIPDYTQRPFTHGSTVRPSGGFPSSLDSEFGSNRAGISADASARLMRSLTALWRPADALTSRSHLFPAELLDARSYITSALDRAFEVSSVNRFLHLNRVCRTFLGPEKLIIHISTN